MPILKWFRVAQSGKTIDNREITPAQIDQMAESYDPKKYAAMVFCEHMRSMMPDGPFGTYGDVLGLRAEDGENGGRVLLAQVDATDAFVKLAAQRQKRFWSIEMATNFAGTGKAYMYGLSITDSPASLGTEMIKFSLSTGNASDRIKNNLFSVPIEGPTLELEQAPASSDTKPSWFTNLMDRLKGKAATDDARFAVVEEAFGKIADEIACLKDGDAKYAALKGEHDKLASDFAALKAQLEKSPGEPERQKTSGTTFTATDC